MSRADDPAIAASLSEPPETPLRIGIIGVGGISQVHRDGYLGAGAEVVALSDPNTLQLEARSRAWGVTRTYSDFRAMLADGDLDAVSICAPTSVHAPATIAAATAGVHVLCEKPLALDLDQGPHHDRGLPQRRRGADDQPSAPLARGGRAGQADARARRAR